MKYDLYLSRPLSSNIRNLSCNFKNLYVSSTKFSMHIVASVDLKTNVCRIGDRLMLFHISVRNKKMWHIKKLKFKLSVKTH